MSWDKNTVNCSEIDTVIGTLDDCQIPFTLTKIGEFNGCGLNDMYNDRKEPYQLRQLNYKDITILEYVEKDADCDTDDVILSQKFTRDNKPKEWQLIRWTDKNHVMEDGWESKQEKSYINLEA
jgi:hypothetical protein